MAADPACADCRNLRNIYRKRMFFERANCFIQRFERHGGDYGLFYPAAFSCGTEYRGNITARAADKNSVGAGESVKSFRGTSVNNFYIVAAEFACVTLCQFNCGGFAVVKDGKVANSAVGVRPKAQIVEMIG